MPAVQFQSTNLSSYVAISQLLGKKILDKKNLANILQFVKFTKIFSIQNFVLYGIYLC